MAPPPQLESHLRGASGGTLPESALSKFRKHVPALALTLHVAAGKSGPVGPPSPAQTLELVNYLQARARRTYASGIRPAVKVVRAFLAKIRSGSLDHCSSPARSPFVVNEDTP